jgi:hypothetical protein
MAPSGKIKKTGEKSMKRQTRISMLSILLILLIAAAAVFTGCTQPTTGNETGLPYGVTEIVAERDLGAGDTTFTFTVVNGEGNATVYTIQRNASDLRTALTEHGLIPAGNKGDLVNTVDGITADWSVDQGWWMLAAGGSTEMLNYGVDDAAITEGADYAFIYKKGF